MAAFALSDIDITMPNGIEAPGLIEVITRRNAKDKYS